MNFSIVIPTCGRETLMRTLASIRNAGIDPMDEVIVVGDGPQPNSEEMCRTYRSDGMPVVYLEGPRTHCFGNSQRNLGMSVASKEVLLFMDDDDEYLPNLFPDIRNAVRANPGKIILGKMQHRTIGVIWRDRSVRVGNVGTQMYVIPNVKHQLGHWPEIYSGDFHFLEYTLSKWPGGIPGIVWWERLFAIHHKRPENPSAL